MSRSADSKTGAVSTGAVSTGALSDNARARVQKRLGKLVIYNNDDHDFNEEFMFQMKLNPRSVRPNKARWVLPEGFSPMNPAAYWRAWKGADPEWEAKMVAAVAQNEAELEGAPPVEPAVSPVDRQGIRLQ